MPLREDILAPIPGENPSGIDLRYDTKLLIHDKIKENRRQDDDAAQGDWQTERNITFRSSSRSRKRPWPPHRKICRLPHGWLKLSCRQSATPACARASSSVWT